MLWDFSVLGHSQRCMGSAPVALGKNRGGKKAGKAALISTVPSLSVSPKWQERKNRRERAVAASTPEAPSLAGSGPCVYFSALLHDLGPWWCKEMSGPVAVCDWPA